MPPVVPYRFKARDKVVHTNPDTGDKTPGVVNKTIDNDNYEAYSVDFSSRYGNGNDVLIWGSTLEHTSLVYREPPNPFDLDLI